jgi:transcriptional regulator with XRE-family HTH domain
MDCSQSSITYEHERMAIDPEDTGDLQHDVARRLILSREAVGMEQQDFADLAGLSQPRLSQYETGTRMLTLRAAMMICERHLLTLDWLFRGDPSSLPGNIRDKINSQRRSKR